VYVVCYNGVFVLPDDLFEQFAQQVPKRMVYLREDDDVLTIARERIPGGRRRQLGPRYRSPMFRDAKLLAIVNYRESLRVMAVE
jgi:hypothetical protein